MARFKYKSLAPDGAYSEGVMGAVDRDAVVARLRDSNHLPVMVSPHDGDDEAAAAAADIAPPSVIAAASAHRRRRATQASFEAASVAS